MWARYPVQVGGEGVYEAGQQLVDRPVLQHDVRQRVHGAQSLQHLALQRTKQQRRFNRTAQRTPA